MTKFYTLTLALFAFTLGLNAQVNVLWDDDPGVNYNGDTLQLVANTDITVYMHCQNVSGSDIDMKFRRIILSNTTTMTDQFCDNQLCYPTSGNDWTTPAAVTIADQDSSLMKPLLNFSSGGVVHIRYYVVDGGNGDALLDSVDVVVTSTVSVEEAIDISFSSYPNPANDNFFVNFQGNDGVNFNLVIYNVVGSEVMRRTLSNGTNKISVEDLNSGVYFYSIVANSEIIETKKLIVRH